MNDVEARCQNFNPFLLCLCFCLLISNTDSATSNRFSKKASPKPLRTKHFTGHVGQQLMFQASSDGSSRLILCPCRLGDLSADYECTIREGLHTTTLTTIKKQSKLIAQLLEHRGAIQKHWPHKTDIPCQKEALPKF